MPTVRFIEHDGTEHVVEAAAAASVMQAATSNLVPGIVADCGGAGNCATCHGYVDEAWIARVPTPSADELDMIDAGCLHSQPNSRLTCQIVVTEALDGLTILLPPSQS